MIEQHQALITGPKLSDIELEKLYDRELKRARMFAKDAMNRVECEEKLNGI